MAHTTSLKCLSYTQNSTCAFTEWLLAYMPRTFSWWHSHAALKKYPRLSHHHHWHHIYHYHLILFALQVHVPLLVISKQLPSLRACEFLDVIKLPKPLPSLTAFLFPWHLLCFSRRPPVTCSTHHRNCCVPFFPFKLYWNIRCTCLLSNLNGCLPVL